MYDIKKRPDKTAWINFSDDERYKLRHVPHDILQKKNEKNPDEFAQIIIDNVLDWEGIVCDGEPMLCNDENKKLVFLDDQIWAVERLQFVMVNIIKQDNFFNVEENLKNLTGRSVKS